MSQPATDFAKEWNARFGHIPPLGYLLRFELPDRWTRFHALPGSKRSAQTSAEQDEVLRRANALAAAIFAESTSLWLCVPVYPGSHGAGRKLINQFGLTPALTWTDPTDPPDERTEVIFHAAQLDWAPNVVDPVVLSVAKGEAQAVIFCPESGLVLSPYEGGFDLILDTSDRVRQIEHDFSGWMSDRPDKL